MRKHMAFAVDAITNGGENTSSFNHTVGTLTDGLLIVMIAVRNGTDTISGVTYNGDALTLANTSSGNNMKSEIWYRVNPDAGTNSVSISGSFGDDYWAVAASYSGVDTSDPLNNINDGTGTGTNPSISVTPDENSALVVGVVASEDGVPATGTGETTIANGDGGTWGAGFSYAIQGVAGAQAVNWTLGADNWAGAVASFNTSGVKVDAVSSSGAQNSVDPWAWNHTVAGTNRILVVAVTSYNQHPTGVTYNGDAMTVVSGAQINITDKYVSLWYLYAPDTGTNSVSVDFTSPTYGIASAISFEGAAQSGQPDSSAEETGNSATTNSLSVTTVEDNVYFVDAIITQTSFFTAGPTSSGGIHLHGPTDTTLNRTSSAFRTYGTAGSKTSVYDWTMSLSSSDYAHAGIAIYAADETPADLSVAPSDSITVSESRSVELQEIEHELNMSNPTRWKRGVKIWP